jgi:hypothetical protein
VAHVFLRYLRKRRILLYFNIDYSPFLASASYPKKRRDSLVGLVRATGWAAGVRFPAEARCFSLLHSVQTGSGTHLMGIVIYFPWGKAAGA